MNSYGIHSPLKAWKKGDYPIAPFLHLVVTTDDGTVLLGPQLMTEREIDDAFERRGKGLKVLGQIAKRELASLKATILEQ